MASRFLIITEKPSSARKIAQALDDKESPKNAKYGRVSFYIANHCGDELIVVSAVGHLYSIEQQGREWTYPIFDISWVPAYIANKKIAYTKQYLEAIIGLSANMDAYISACDYDQEGSLIAFNIIRQGIGEKALIKSRRMLYSTLTHKELIVSWEKLTPTLDFKVAAAGKARHEVDWLFGINLSRALTIAARQYMNETKVLSIGRVQGPTLQFVYELETSIQSFVPIPYWRVNAEVEIDEEFYNLEYEKSKLERELHAKDLVRECRSKTGKVIEVKSEETRIPPPPPFNLGDLYSEAFRHLKINPSTILKVTEKLYLGAYISYPRTESNKIPTSIDVREILENLSKNHEYDTETRELLSEKRFKPRQGKSDDPAHPAIYPTGLKPRKLRNEEWKVYDLIVRRFFASLGEPLVQSNTNIKYDVNGHIFFLKGVKTQKPGWTTYYAKYFKSRDQKIPEVKVGKTIKITKLSTRRQYSKPPQRFNTSSLIRRMEQKAIGTKATRSAIVDTLYQRGYIHGQQISITSLGENVIKILKRYCPEIAQIDLTKKLEEDLKEVEAGRKDSQTIFREVKEELLPILTRFKENEEQIGHYLSDAIMNKTVNYSDEPCKICNQAKKNSVFCINHTKAYESLEEGFNRWRYALGIQWIEYLEKLVKVSGTGRYVVDIINYILS